VTNHASFPPQEDEPEAEHTEDEMEVDEGDEPEEEVSLHVVCGNII